MPISFSILFVLFFFLIEKSGSLLLSKNGLKELLRESLTDEFHSYIEEFAYKFHFCPFYAVRRL